MIEIQMPRGKFVRVVCRKCRNEQIAFNKASTIVKCFKCNNDLIIPTGGEAKFIGRVARTFP